MGDDRITAVALLHRIDAGTAPPILDVRSRSEYRHGHVPGARHIPFWLLPRRIDQVPGRRDVELVVYCGHGPRASVAGTILKRSGFTRVVYLDGHYSHWRNAGLREERE